MRETPLLSKHSMPTGWMDAYVTPVYGLCMQGVGVGSFLGPVLPLPSCKLFAACSFGIVRGPGEMYRLVASRPTICKSRFSLPHSFPCSLSLAHTRRSCRLAHTPSQVRYPHRPCRLSAELLASKPSVGLPSPVLQCYTGRLQRQTDTASLHVTSSWPLSQAWTPTPVHITSKLVEQLRPAIHRR
ncbi:hypothetical protein LZ30DRAFT_173746 [Colletotrichum cereale]|nr:hypothetical protein LZ30DRAFT_173746 [Colletotrichum cereale]